MSENSERSDRLRELAILETLITISPEERGEYINCVSLGSACVYVTEELHDFDTSAGCWCSYFEKLKASSRDGGGEKG